MTRAKRLGRDAATSSARQEAAVDRIESIETKVTKRAFGKIKAGLDDVQVYLDDEGDIGRYKVHPETTKRR